MTRQSTDESDGADEQESSSSSSSEEEYIDLPPATGMQQVEANELARRVKLRVILFAGTAKSGKTTLLSSLYLLFQSVLLMFH